MTHSLFTPTPETSEYTRGVFVPDDGLSLTGTGTILVRAGGQTILECHAVDGMLEQGALVAALEAWLEAAYPVPGCQPPYVYELRLL